MQRATTQKNLRRYEYDMLKSAATLRACVKIVSNNSDRIGSRQSATSFIL